MNCNLIDGGGTVINLTAGGTTGPSVTTNGAILTTTDSQSTGTGVIQSFVRLTSNDPCIQGYNTSARPLEFDENNSPQFTRDLALAAVPIVTIGGIQYREFLLDINQQSADSLLSLNNVEIYLHNSTEITGYDFGLAPIWELDGAGNRIVELDYNLNSGSGSGDLFLYVPNSLFVGGTQVTLFSQFGDSPNENNDGFEEWAVRTTVSVAEPGILALLGIALLALGGTRRRRTV